MILGKLIELRDEVVVEAESEKVEDVLLVDEVEEVVEAEVDEDEVVEVLHLCIVLSCHFI